MIGKLSITGTPPNWRVEVDGHPMPASSVNLHLEHKSVPSAVIAFAVLDDVNADTQADIAVDEHTRRALLRLGWTPPPDDGDKPAMSDQEFAQRLRKWVRMNPYEWQRWLTRYHRVHGNTVIT